MGVVFEAGCWVGSSRLAWDTVGLYPPENFNILNPKKWRVFDSDDFFPLQNSGAFFGFFCCFSGIWCGLGEILIFCG